MEEFKKWIKEIASHEEKIIARAAYSECVEALTHPRYEGFLSERYAEAGHKLCKIVADDEKDHSEMMRWATRRAVFARVLHRYREVLA